MEVANWQSRYRQILFEARSQAMTIMPRDVRIALARIYVQEMDRVLTRYELEEITQEEAERLMEDLGRALVRYGQRSELAVKRAIVQMMETMATAHEEAFAMAVEATDSPVRASFASVPTDAYEQMFLRRSMGVTESYKTLSRYPLAYGKMLERALDEGVLRGGTYTEVAKGIASGLAGGDPYLQRVTEQYGLRGGLRRAARAEGAVFDAEASAVARRVGYDALRISRTEMQAAYWEADRVASIASPVTSGLKINLSHRHPLPDVCDLLAKLDLYGMGPGVYPADAAPAHPHAHCFCYFTHEIRDDEEWDMPKPDFDEPTIPNAVQVASLMKGASANDIQRAQKHLRRDVVAAYRATRVTA